MLLASTHFCRVFGASTELSRLMSTACWAYMELAASPGCTASSSYQLFHILPTVMVHTSLGTPRDSGDCQIQIDLPADWLVTSMLISKLY